MMGDIERIREALHVIPASDRDTWVKMGMAVKSELGENGFDLWDTWSRTADNYDPKAAQTTWRSITPDGGVTVGSLFHEARQHGFRANGESRPRPASSEEIAERDRREQEHERARQRAHEDAAKRAGGIIEAATGDPTTHPYAVKKRVPLGPLVKRGPWLQRGWGDALLVPIYGVDERVQSIEAINSEPGADGKFPKDSLAHGKKIGAFYPLGKIGGASRVLIAEGVATAAVGAVVDKSPAVAAMGKWNLLHVARAVRALAPDAELIILADNDLRLPKEAHEAAAAISGRVVVPELDGRECDLWDVWNEHGIEAVTAAIAGVNGQATNKLKRVTIIDGDAIRPEPIRWLWESWLARGKLHIMAGAPGCGKTTIELTFAAVVAAGGRWPDGTPCSPGHVLIWSGEDDPGDTLLPRLLAAGGDPRCVHFVGDVIDPEGPRPFDPATDVPALLAAARDIPDLCYVMVDPVVDAVLGDGHKNTEVRRSLQPLVALAADLDVALLGITHFSKGTAGRDPVERVTGSVAFGARARVVLAAARVQEIEGERRTFCRAKSNIGPDTGGWEYTLAQTDVPGTPGLSATRVRWGAVLEGTARDLLATAEAATDPEERGACEQAVDWLRALLADGPVESKQIRSDAKQAGISWRTVERAKTRIGVKATKAAFCDQWRWCLPGHAETEDGQP